MTTTEPAPALTPVPASGLLDKNLTEACRDTEAKIARVDTKVSFLLAFDGAILAGLASLADKPFPLPARIAGGAALVLVAAAVLLLLAVRPNLGRRRVVREGFPAGRSWRSRSCWPRWRRTPVPSRRAPCPSSPSGSSGA